MIGSEFSIFCRGLKRGKIHLDKNDCLRVITAYEPLNKSCNSFPWPVKRLRGGNDDNNSNGVCESKKAQESFWRPQIRIL